MSFSNSTEEDVLQQVFIGTAYDASTKSFVFDGADDMISFYDINVNGYDKITINFWVNLSNDTGGLVQYW